MKILIFGLGATEPDPHAPPGAGWVGAHPNVEARPDWRAVALPSGAPVRPGAARSGARGPSPSVEATLQRARPDGIVLIGCGRQARNAFPMSPLCDSVSLIEPDLALALGRSRTQTDPDFAKDVETRCRRLPGGGLDPGRAPDARDALQTIASWAKPMNVPVLIVHAAAEGLTEAGATSVLGVVAAFEASLARDGGPSQDWTL